MSDDRFYVATISEIDAREAVRRWLTSGMSRVAESSISFTANQLVYLPFAQFRTTYAIRWNADIGVLDRGAYSQAMNIFKMAENDYLRTPSNHRHLILMPYPPAKRDFIQWQHQWDTVHGEWLSPRHMVALPAAHQLDDRIDGWANKLLAVIDLPSGFYRTFGDWSRRGGDTRMFLAPLTDDDVIARFSRQMNSAATKAARATLPKGYVQNVQFEAQGSSHGVTERVVLPVYIVHYEVDGKQRLCLVDGLSATRVIGAKVRDFRGMFNRFFESVKSWSVWGTPTTAKRG